MVGGGVARLGRAGLQGVLDAIAFLSVLTVVLASRFPVFEMLSNFRPQWFFAVMVLLPGLALARLWKELAAMSLVAFMLGTAVLPYLRTTANPVPLGVETATFLQYNVLFTNNDVDAITNVVLDADADVVALHELTVPQWDLLQKTLAERYPHQLASPFDARARRFSRRRKSTPQQTPSRRGAV